MTVIMLSLKNLNEKKIMMDVAAGAAAVVAAAATSAAVVVVSLISPVRKIATGRLESRSMTSSSSQYWTLEC